jgi:hypothetical protein
VSFATWKAGPPARDAASQASNPGGTFTVAGMFTSITDLHLINEGTNPASNTGAPVASFTTDFDNDPRSVSTPDIGFDEFIVVAAVPVTISGQVTTSSGRYISGAVVTLTEQNGTPHYAITNSFGYYKFFNILTQQTVTVSPAAKRYTFTPAVFPLTGNTTTNFQASP